MEKLLKLDPTNTELLAQKQALLSQAVAETSTKLETLKTAAEQAAVALANGEISQQQYDALQREIIATEQALESLTQRADESYTALQQMANAGESMKTLGTNIENVGNKLAPVSAAVTALGVGAVTTAANFESSMSNVQATLGITSDAMSTLNGESVNTMDALSDLALQMGSETAHSASSCAEAINFLALAGYDTQQIYDTLPAVLDLASAGAMELSTASDMVTDAMSALGLEVDQADSMVDQMAKTSSSTNTSVTQLGEAILQIGGTAKSMAGGTAELNTALGILADAGIKGSDGGTALRNVILSLQSPATDLAGTLMNSLGVSAYDASGEMRSLNDILGDLNTSMDGMTSQEKDNIITTIFNKTDLKSVNALLASTGESWDNLQNSITDSGGAAAQMAETQLDNLQGQLTILSSALEGLAISLGQLLLPYIKAAAESVQGFVDWLNGLDEEMQALIVVVGVFVAALAPVLIVIGKVTTAIGSILTLAPQLGTAITAVRTAFAALNVTMLANPFALVLAAVAALSAGILYLWNTNEGFRNGVISVFTDIENTIYTVCLAIVTFQEEAWNGIKGIFTDSIEFVKTTVIEGWEKIKTTFSEFMDAIKTKVTEGLENIKTSFSESMEVVKTKVTQGWENIKTSFSESVENIKTKVSEGLENIKTKFSESMENVKTKVIEGWTNIKTTFSESIENIKAKVSEGWTNIKTTFADSVENIKAKVSEGWETIKTTFTLALSSISTGVTTSFNNMLSGITSTMGNIYTAIKTGLDSGVNYIKNLISQSYTWGKDLISGMVQGIKDSISAVTSAVKDVADTIWSYLHFTVPEVGPLTDYETWMPDFMEGLAKGINSSKSLVTNAMDGLASDMILSPNAQISTDSITGTSGGSSFDISSLVSGITSALQGTTGDITIPVSIGQNMIEEIVIIAQQRMNLKSGGH